MITKAKKTIYFLLPGLLRLPQSALPPTLLRLLSRASLHPRQALFQGIAPRKIPAAALSAYHHNLIARSETKWSCHVDMIQCQLDHRMVYAVAPEEREININQLDQLFKLDNLTLSVNPSGGGICFSDTSPEIIFSDLSEIIGKPLFPFLPKGPAQSYWRRLLTECQMLLQETGSSIWFWGEGHLPEKVCSDFRIIYSASDVIHGLAKCAGVPSFPIPGCFDLGLIEKGSILLAGKPWVPGNESKYDEENWFRPLHHALQQRKIDQLVIDGADGRLFHITPRRLHYFWKKVKTFDNENTPFSYY